MSKYNVCFYVLLMSILLAACNLPEGVGVSIQPDLLADPRPDPLLTIPDPPGPPGPPVPLKVDPDQILAQGEDVLDPPPGFESSWIYPADYRVEDLSLYRSWELISLWHEPYDFGLNWYQPYLGYQLTIGNNGEPLPEEQADWVGNNTLIRNLEGTINSVGSEGQAYYHQLGNAAPACWDYQLLAFIPNGLSGDPNPANDWGVGIAEDVGSIDRDIRFTSDGPSARYYGQGYCFSGLLDPPDGLGTVCGDLDSGTPENPSPTSSSYLRIRTESESIGSCPPLLSDTAPFTPTGDPIEIEADRYHVWVTVYHEGEFISMEEHLPPEVNPAVSLPGDLDNNDVICVDVELDPPNPSMDHGFILETDESNNRVMQIYWWDENFLKGNELRLINEITEPPFPTCLVAYANIAQYKSRYPTLGTFVGILGLGFVGGMVGLFIGRRSAGLATKLPFVIASGVIIGGVIGGLFGFVAGSSLTPVPSDFSGLMEDQTAVIQPVAQPLIDLSSLFEQEETCEAYFKTYAETVTNQAGDIEDLLVFIAVPSNVTLPADHRFQVTLWDKYGFAHQFATNNTVLSLADLGLFPDQISSPLLWQVGMEVLAGTGGDLFLPHCLPDGLHTFRFDSVEGSQEREMPTPTATSAPQQAIPTKVPPTATTPPKVSDTSGPKVSGATASPNPALTTSPVTISASISDGSGVASATVYYGTDKGGYQSAGGMKSGGGNQYFLNIGTLTPAGNYTFRIHTVDSLGNANCSTGSLDSCPGGSFTVNIP